MVWRYTKEHIAFVRKITPGRYDSEIAELFNEKFGINLSLEQIKALKGNHKIRSGMRGKRTGIEPANKIFTDEMALFIKENCTGLRNDDLARMINGKFNTKVSAKQVGNYKKRNNLRSGLDMRFQKGIPSPLKGLKQSDFMTADQIERSKVTRFKAGNVPNNIKPIGSERLNKNGYISVKVTEDGPPRGQWIQKQRAVWEQVNGPIPKGHAIAFLDRDRTNCNINNLKLVTKAEIARLNHQGLLGDNVELNEVAFTIAKLVTKSAQIKKCQGGS